MMSVSAKVAVTFLLACLSKGLAVRLVGVDCEGQAQRCLDCTTALQCVKLSSAYHPVQKVQCPSATPHCSAGTCVATPGDGCDESVRSFICNGDGYFPDPGSCRRYWMCVGESAFRYDCGANEAYSHEKAMCVLSSEVRCASATCSAALVGRYQRHPSAPGVYFVCRDEDPDNALVASCPDDHEVDVETGSCVRVCLAEKRLPDKNNATRYYECTKNSTNTFSEPALHVCPEGSSFDETQERCVTGREGAVDSEAGYYEDYYEPDSSIPESYYNLPEDFIIGAGSAAYQVEGAWNVSDKSASIQDVYYHARPSLANGDVASNSYYQYADDVAALKELKVDYYRFSFAWTRLLPHADISKPSADGAQYYHNLIDALLKENIEPVVTLYHWDLPEELQQDGGWLNPAIQERFVEYASYCFQTFGDKVRNWILLNEPFSHCLKGYEVGSVAPGVSMSGTGAYRCSHNMVLSHARAYRLYQEKFKAQQNGRVGSAINMFFPEPKSRSVADREAAERWAVWQYASFADPLIFGDYPDLMRQTVDSMSVRQGLNQSRLPSFTEDEKAILKGATDYLGLNNYFAMKCTAMPASASGTPTPSYTSDVNAIPALDEKWAQGGNKGEFPVTPWSLAGCVKWVSARYSNFPIWVIENGYEGAKDEGTADRGRIGHYSGYLRGLMRAINKDKCNVIGFTAWSLVDSMEWNSGYDAKFGLVQIDFSDKKLPRTIKDSGSFFRLLMSTRYVSYEPVVF